MSKITIGTDPEFFIKKNKKYIAAQNANIIGTKEQPAPLPGGGTVQRDNVLVEFATPPAKNMADFIKKIKSCLHDIHKMVPNEHDIVAEPSASLTEDQLIDPETQEFGCDPDFNAYTRSVNDPPWCPDPCFRSSGAHIHVGCLNDNGKVKKGLEFMVDFNGRLDLVKAMDLLLGVVAVTLDNSEAAVQRRQLYGKAGCHRPTTYGVEYRVLSNFWMKSPQLVMLMESLTRDAVALTKSGKLNGILDIVGEEELQRTINECLVDDAKKIIELFVLPNISNESKDYYGMCLENMPKYKSMKEEWGL
jgi:hypothetical protein